MSENFDVIVIGGGPGGYVAAIKAAQLGLKVACVEKRERLGGTCLNEGCIPSKALLHSSEMYEAARTEFDKVGIKLKGIELDLNQMLADKDKTLATLGGGIGMLFKKNKITKITGHGSIKSAQEVVVDGKIYQTKNIILATGSQIASLPNVAVDGKRIISSKEALEIKEVPKKMIVIGGGYIGLELGSVWRRLGAEIEVVEYAERIVPAMDQEVTREFHKILEKQGIKFRLSAKVLSATSTGKEVELVVEGVKDGKQETLKADMVLVSVGRKPYTDNLGLENVGIATDNRGMIEVDHSYATKVKNIYAIGDIIAGPMLAHKAEEEGVAVAEIIAGQKGHVNYEVIPAVVYTYPEVATVGKTEEELKTAGVEYNVGKFSMMANSRAKTLHKEAGFVKLLACKKTDRVLGAHIIGHEAGTMIAEIAAVMEFGGSSEDIARTCHAHPTLNEAVKEAALATFFKPIHS